MKRIALCLTLVLSGCAVSPAPDKQPVDLMVINANLLTVDESFSIAQNMAIHNGRVVATGGEELLSQYSAPTMVDMLGATVMPGFNDSHSHIASFANHYIALGGVRSIRALKAEVAAKISELPAGSWITGYGWSEDELAEGRRPLRADLDAVAPDNPVVLTRAGGHSAVANSLALSMAGLTPTTPQPEGGVIEQDEQGHLNGIIRERQDLITDLIPPATEEELEASLSASLKALLPFGITSVTQASDQLESWPRWQRIYQQQGDALPRASVQMHWRGEAEMQRFRDTALLNVDQSRLRLGPIKIFVDGGFTGPAAYTKAPYRGETSYRGHLNIPEPGVYQLVKGIHAAGWQMGIHAIGDAAIEMTVHILDDVLQNNPRDNHRHYLNHFSMRPSDKAMATMARQGIAITQQPNFTYTLAGRYATYLDGWRLQHNNPLRSPMDAGIFVAISSDILPIGPMVGLFAATTREGMDGNIYGQEEAISIEEAIIAYTHGGAWLSFEDDEKGRLTPGMLADFIVLNNNPLTTPPDQLMSLEVTQTWINGKLVWAAQKEQQDSRAEAQTP